MSFPSIYQIGTEIIILINESIPGSVAHNAELKSILRERLNIPTEDALEVDVDYNKHQDILDEVFHNVWPTQPRPEPNQITQIDRYTKDAVCLLEGVNIIESVSSHEGGLRLKNELPSKLLSVINSIDRESICILLKRYHTPILEDEAKSDAELDKLWERMDRYKKRYP